MPTLTSTLRDFTPADYAAWVEVGNGCWPDYPTSVEETRHWDSTWDEKRLFKRRIVAEVDGKIVGKGEMNHHRWNFVPDKYSVSVSVLPEHRGRGIGASLFDEIGRTAKERSAKALATSVKESMTEGMRFAARRDFREVKRDWESRLDVTAFDFAAFADAPKRIVAEGIAVTTLAAELARDPRVLASVYELDCDCSRDVPAVDPFTAPPFEEWKKIFIGGPTSLPEAFFLAVKDGGYLGVSNMYKALGDDNFLWQGLTGVRREARGKGVAMALKLETVRYAKGHGYREIKTWNDQKNEPMLRINEAMGFARQPAWIEMEQELAR